jgi:hypothetical protein
MQGTPHNVENVPPDRDEEAGSSAAASRSATRSEYGTAPASAPAPSRRWGLTMLSVESPAEGDTITVAPVASEMIR